MKPTLGVMALALPLLIVSPAAVTADAASEPAYYAGSALAGVLPSEETEVMLESECITFRVDSLPRGEEDDPGARMEAEYTFYNPTEKDAEVGLLFPCGIRPEYFAESCYDRPGFAISADGVPVTPDVRYTYGDPNRSYSDPCVPIESGLVQLRGGCSDPFYCTEGLPLTVYTCQVDLDEEPSAGGCTCVLTFDCNPRKSRVMSETGYLSVSNGRGKAKFFLGQGENVLRLMSVGEPLKLCSAEVYTYDDFMNDSWVEAVAVTSETKDFRSYVDGLRPADSAIAEEDWFCGCAEMLASNAVNGFMSYMSPSALGEEDFMPWYAYAIEVPSHGRVRHTIETAVYPAKMADRYEYEYLFTPSWAWDEVGEVEIRLSTPYYLQESTFSFERGEDVYLLAREGLPQDELRFVISEREPTASIRGGADDGLTVAFCILGAIAAGAAVTVVVWLCVRRRNRRRAAQQRRDGR